MNFIAKSEKRNKIVLPEWGLIFVAILSLSMHLITYTFSAKFYLLLYVFSLFVYVAFRPIVRNEDNLTYLWLLTECYLVFALIGANQQFGTTMDILVLMFGIFLIIFPAKEQRYFSSAIRAAYYISLIYTFGILIQAVMPFLYYTLLSVFPYRFSAAVRNGINGQGINYNGFTTNVGFAAGFISTGFMALISSDNKIIRQSKQIKMICGGLMLIALMLTGKRAHTLFLCATIAVGYLVSADGFSKFKRYWKLILVVGAVLVAGIVFKDKLITIPIFRRLFETIEGIQAGEDVSSARSKLYAWALVLFKQNPLLGIGWGNYRTTVAGNVTVNSDLEVHNIYLQLLCETGIVGTVCLVSVFIVSWYCTQKALKNSMQSRDFRLKQWRPVLYFSFLFQTFFLMYGLTGNPLYDQNYQIMYLLSCSIMAAYRCVRRYYC